LLLLTPAAGADQPAAAPAHTDRYGDPLPDGAVARLGTLRFRHGWRIHKAFFSPDGRRFATAGDGRRSICLWDAETGRELSRGPLFGRRDHLLGFSPDGKTLAVSDRRGPAVYDIRLLDVATGQEVRRFTAPHSLSRWALFTPDGKLLVTAGGANGIYLWDVATGKELRRLAEPQGMVNAVAVSPDEKTVAANGSDGLMRLWDVASGKELGCLAGHKGEVTSVAFAPGGAVLISGGADGCIRLWDVPARKLRRVLGRHPSSVTVVLSPDGRTLASCDYLPGNVALWDVTAGKLIRSWRPGGYASCQSGFSPDGKTLITTAFTEGAPRFWDVASGKEVKRSRGHRAQIGWLAFAPDGQSLLSCDFSQSILRWDLATGWERPILTLPIPTSIRSTLSPDHRTLATWGSMSERGLRLWHLPAGQELQVLGRHQWNSNRAASPWIPFAFSADGRRLAAVSGERISLWDAVSARKVRDLEGLRGDVRCTAMSPDGRLVAAGTAESGERAILVWDTATGKELQALGNDGTESLAFSPNGRLLLSAGYASAVRLWDVATGREWCTLAGPVRPGLLRGSPGRSPTSTAPASRSASGPRRNWSSCTSWPPRRCGKRSPAGPRWRCAADWSDSWRSWTGR
jgi:WD40 repeat protein